jgi:diaminopimelate decarboxylase
MATGTSLSPVFPLGSRLNERGVLEIGGCDALELAREFGTPAYVVAEEDLRARARAFVGAARGLHPDMHVVFASKAFPCTAVLSLFAAEGLWCDVATGGELYLALNAGFAPERLVMHGNAKSEAELRMALRHRIGLIAIDNFDEVERLGELIADGALGDREGGQPVLLRVTPDVRGDTHEKISTGQADSKFGFSMDEVQEAIARVRGTAGLALHGLHAHIGSQLLELEPFRRACAQLATLGDFQVIDVGGGLGAQYLEDQPAPPSVEDYLGVAVQELGGHSGRLLVEPGRALTANAGVTLYTVESVRQNVSRWVAVDGGMSDNLRPMLYGARYEAQVADRFGGTTSCVLAGKHCESGDVIARDVLLDDPRRGDVIVTPATGAYGYAMANNYNGVPRPPVIFCAGGDARVVVRRESFEDLIGRDLDPQRHGAA